jgi:exodeoxyribonuclease V alpha subunit
MNIPAEDLRQGIDYLEETGDIVREGGAVYLYDYFEAEQYIVTRIARMTARPPEPEKELADFIASIEIRRGIKYAGEQRKAVSLAGTVQIMAITGGPGTGKTTAIRGILDLYKMMD